MPKPEEVDTMSAVSAGRWFPRIEWICMMHGTRNWRSAMAEEIQVTCVMLHVVGLGPIKVIVCNEGGSWFAQGLDIDYASSGDTFEAVQENFEEGLVATIDLHIKAYNNLKKFLKPAPKDLWDELYAIGGQTFDYTFRRMRDESEEA